MDGTWEHLLQRARLDPAADREALYRFLLSRPTYVIHVGTAERPEMELRSRADETLSLWVDQDSALGGFWIPVFSSPEAVARYVAARELSAPQGQDLYWMAHDKGRVYSLLQAADRFAGIRLDPGADAGVAVSWPEVNALSEGRVPAEAPFRYDLPLSHLRMPRGARLAVAPMDPELTRCSGLQGVFRDVGQPEPEDLRFWVAIQWDAEGASGEESVWTPCRHFAIALRHWMESERRPGPYADALMRCLMGFEMYGEAEALCDWLSAQDGNEAYAWVFLSAIYGRTGKLDSCAKLCEKGMWKYRKERSFYLNQARAYAQLDDRLAAQESARRGLAEFPGDSALLRFI